MKVGGSDPSVDAYRIKISDISGSNGCEYEDYSLL
jgi:hypothetical protein